MLFNFDRFFDDKTARNDFSDNDACRMAAFFVQDGRCYVTGEHLMSGERELHHRLPRSLGGQDTPENLVLLSRRIHQLVHTNFFDQAYILLRGTGLAEKQLHLVNQLRLEARKHPIEPLQGGK